MRKSLINNISLGIACLLGVGGSITAGVLSTNSPSIKSAEATTYGLHVGNIEVTSENLTIDSSDTAEITSGSATYNPETKTLTLDNFNYQGAGYTGSWEAGVIDRRGDDLTILLKGNNSILKQNDNSMSNSYGIYFNGEGKSLTIDEDSEGGSLEISFWADRSGGKSNGIFLEPGSFVMNGGTVVSNAGLGDESAGIYADSGITFNGGSFTGIGFTTTAYESRGIYAHGVITINGGEVFGYAPLDNPYAAYGYDNYEIRFNAGDLYAKGKTAFKNASYVYYPSGTTILGGDNETSATEQTNVKGDLHYYNLSFTTHEHNWSYTADGASITAECLNSGCPITTGLTLTVSDPADIVYDGTAKEIQLNSYNKKVFDTPEIKYYKDNVLVSECINAGSYEARVSANGKTAIKSFSITKADGTLTPPTAKTKIGYTGSAQKLVNAGSTSDGTIYYRLEDGEYSANIPTAIDPGTYNVYYKLIGDDNHNDGPVLGPIESKILNGEAAVTIGTTTNVYDTLASALSDWNKAADGATLTLLKDVTVSSTTTVTSSKILDLNGYGIRMTNTNFRIFDFSGGGLTINDSDPGHEHAITLEGWRGTSISDGSGTTNVDFNGNGTVYITGGYITGAYVTISSSSVGAGAAFKFNNSNIVINGGTIIGNYLIYNGCHGSAFYITNNSYLTMNGGSIEYNYSQNDAAALSVENSTVEINGGNISHNRNDFSGGAAISGGIEHSTFTLKLYGGHIEENVSMHNDGNVISKHNETEKTTYEIKGSPTIQNNSIQKSGTNINFLLCNKINVVGALTEGARIGVTLTGTCGGEWSSDGTGSITQGWSTYMGNADPADYFFANDPNYYIYLKDGEAYYDKAPAAKVQNGEVITYYEDFSDALTAWTNGTTLTLLDNVNLSSQITINDTKIFDLNGYGIITTTTFNDSLFLINNGGNLTLNDSGDTIHYFFFDRYKGYDAGLATVCDKATYDTKSEDSRGTFSGGYITGLHITAENPVARGAFRIETGGTLTMNGGTIIGNYSDNSASGVCSDGLFVMNGGNMIYNINRQGAINPRYGTLVINGGNISHNIGENENNIGRAGAIFQYVTVDCTIRGGTITNNVARQGAIASQCNIAIEGDPVIKDNIAVGEDGNSNDPMNILLCLEHESKLVFIGEFTGKDPIGVTVNMPSVRDITDSTDVSFNNINNVVYDDPNYAVGQYPSDHAKNGQLFYAKLETKDVIDAIDNIGSLTYDGGKDDSLKDIITAIDGYNNLPQADKDFVDEINADILNHDVTTYENVDKVGDLIKAIPEPSPDKSYYDAIDLAITEYNKLTEEELTLLNSQIDFEKILNDNNAARKVIIEIEEIGEVTYDGGINDSKKDIEKAEKSYDELSKDQKDIVDYVNHDVLVDDREIYDQMAKAIKAIKDIGKVENNEETKEKIEEARKIYDSLPEELKEFVKQYEDSLKVLEDDEKVLDVLVLIDDIGDVNYDSASQEKIEEARRLYDSLTEEQKELVDPKALAMLEEKEATYTSLNNTGNSLLVVFLIISGLLLILGLIMMYFIIRKKKEDNGDDNNDNSSNKSKTMKLASFTGLMPFIIYTSHYLDPGYIILYIIIALTVIVWLTNLVLFILKKKGLLNKKKEESKPIETIKEPEPVKPTVIAKEVEPVNEEEEEIVTITDEKGNIFNIRYIKSFTAKLIQSPDETKKYYEELKNYVLSYKKTTSRVSWHYDSINSGRNQVLKFAIRGKTLCVYYPLNAEDYNDTKYKVEAVESKKFEEVPCLYRIKNDRRLGYAKDLIDTVMANLGLEKGEEQHEVYANLPYEENRPLILRGLIKEQKVQVNKPVEQVVSKKVNDDGDEIITTKDSSGNLFEIRYIKSFTAKLSQASAEVKDYYNELKNYTLSYKKANSRVSWHFDSINVGRNQVIKFSIRGKTLCVYYALNANDYLDTKYKVEQVESKKFEEVPCLYRIKNDRRRDYAKDLIDTVMANVPTEKGKESSEDFRIPYESTKALLAKGLIKENKVQVNKPVEDKPVEQMSEDEGEVITITDEKGNIFNIRYIKSFTAKLIQSPEETKKYYEELKNYVLSYKKTTSRVSWHYDSINSGRNQVLKFAIRGKTLCVYYPLNAEDYNDTKYKVEAVDSKKFEEVPCLYRIKNDRRLGYAKDLIDTVMANLGLEKGEEQHEVYSNLPYEPNAPLIARGLIKEQKVQVNKPVAPVVIKAEEVDAKMSDEEATSQIKEDSVSNKHIGKKGIVNIDVIAKSFINNEVVNIESLWEKKIISKNIGHVKVLARGSLDKKLNIELQDYSLQAVKMILLAGGTVKRVK